MASTHRDHLPGAYPDSNPATPNEQGLAPQNQTYIQGHDQRNKLHKSADPRSHNFSDARLGNIESQPIENKSDVSQRRFYGSSSGEAVGGGFYNHGNDPTMFNSNHPRVSELPRPSVSLENTDREPAFGDQHEYTFSKPVPTVAKEQGFREIDARQAPQQGFREVDSRPDVESHPAARRESVATSSQGADEQLSNIGDKSSNDDAASRSDDASGAAPYWGDLPKASQGGIYNTVTGHGSAHDDHDEHHHLPQRSAEDSDDRTHITGLGTDVPSGGVYNTVAGHGSNDEESRRHLEESNNNNLKVNIPEPRHGGTATINSTDAVFDAPLAAVPEDKPLASDNFSQAPTNAPDAGTVTGTDRKDLAPGFLPELAAADDAKLLADSAANRKQRAGSTDNGNVFDAHAHDSYQKDSATSAGSNARNTDLKTQRAFPLTGKHPTTVDDAMRKDDAASSANQHPLRHKEAFAAGAAGLGAGALAKKHHDDRDAQKNLGEDTLSKEWDTVPENLDHPARNHPDGGAAAAVSHRRKSQELDEAGVIPISGSTLEKMKTKEEEKPLGEDTLDVWDTTPENLQKPASHHSAHAAAVQQPSAEHRLAKEPSPAESDSTGEKKHRGLLGIFHRHKDDQEEDTTATEPPKDKGRNKLVKKDAALAAGTGAAAGYGLSHHHKKDDKDAAAADQNQRKSFSGPSAHQSTDLDQKRRASEAAPVSHHRNPSDAQSSIPPVPAVGAVSTNAPSHGLSQAQRDHAPASKIPVAVDNNTHDKLNSNTARAGMAGAALAGVAGGIGAAKYASAEDNKQTIHPERDVSQVTGGVGAPAAAGTGPVTSGGMYHTENPRQAPADLEHPRHALSPPTQHAADFTANPTGVKPNEKLARNTAQEPGYNMLMSGTPSGAQPMSTHGHLGKHHKTTSQPGNYNTLASGTPSGVDTTAPVIKDTENRSPINPADHMILASSLPSHKSEKQQGPTTQQPGDYNHLNTGTPSGVAIDNANVGRARSEDQPRTTQQPGNYKHLATGTPSGVIAGATSHQQPSARRASEGVKHNASTDAVRTDSEEGLYNKLSSGTPSGVKISPHHSPRGSHSSAGPAAMTEPVTRADHQDKDGIYRTLASGTVTGVNVAAMHDNRDKAKDDIKDEIHEQSTTNTLAAKSAAQQAAAQPAHTSQHSAVTPVVRSTQYGGLSESETTGADQRGLPPAESQPKAALPPAESQPVAALPPAESQSKSGHGHSAVVMPTSLHQHKNQNQNQVSDLSAIPTTTRRTQDHYKPVLSAEPPQQFMSPEVMPDAYTTSVPGRNSGAGSGPSVAPATTEPMRAKHMSPEVMPDAYTASAPGHSGAEKINRSIPELTATGPSFPSAGDRAEHVPESTTERSPYPSAGNRAEEATKHMSPQVMPEAYTASVPGHSGAEKTNNGIPLESGVTGRVYPTIGHEHAQPEKHMSPEEMPSAYTASAPGHSVGAEKPSLATANDNNASAAPRSSTSPSTSTTSSLINPALAAASGAWSAASNVASSAISGLTGSGGHGQKNTSEGQGAAAPGASGKQQQQQHSSVLGIHKPVPHKCRHCGQDNDVSEVVETALRGLKGEQGQQGESGMGRLH